MLEEGDRCATSSPGTHRSDRRPALQSSGCTKSVQRQTDRQTAADGEEGRRSYDRVLLWRNGKKHDDQRVMLIET